MLPRVCWAVILHIPEKGDDWPMAFQLMIVSREATILNTANSVHTDELTALSSGLWSR
jgi:hypothetical protein